MAGVAPDGSPIEVYALLPPAGEAEVVRTALPPGASVLDLGSGTGRIAHPLAAWGHRVLAVDESPDMLAHLVGVESVCARIEDLRLDRRFDGVLLTAHLLNTPSEPTRRALLATAAHHLAERGRLVVQWHPPAWFDGLADGQGGRIGPVDVRVADVRRDGDLLTATARYSAGQRRWSHTFTARRLSEEDLTGVLAAAGLSFERWWTPDQAWFTARKPTDYPWD